MNRNTARGDLFARLDWSLANRHRTEPVRQKTLLEFVPHEPPLVPERMSPARHPPTQDQVVERASNLRVHTAILARRKHRVPQRRIEAVQDGAFRRWERH